MSADPMPPELALDEPEPFDPETLGECLLALDEWDQPPPDNAHGSVAWQITDDGAAEWALRALARQQAEIKALEERATAWSAKITDWFERASRAPRRSAEFLTMHLERYALQRRIETAGRLKTLTLPSGRVATRPGSGPKVRVGDPEAFKAWALANLNHPAVRIKAELAAAEAKRAFVFADEQTVVDEITGERVEWAQVEPPSPPSATVTPS